MTSKKDASTGTNKSRKSSGKARAAGGASDKPFSNVQVGQLLELTRDIINRHQQQSQTRNPIPRASRDQVLSLTRRSSAENSSNRSGDKDPISSKHNDSSSRHRHKHKAIKGKAVYEGVFSITQMKQLQELTSEILDQQSKNGNERRANSLQSTGSLLSDMTEHKYSAINDIRVKVECDNRRALMSECKLEQRHVDDYSISTRMSAQQSEQAETDATNLRTKEDRKQEIPETKPSRSFSFKLPSSSASASWETSVSTSSRKDMVATEFMKINTMKVREIKKELKALGVSTDGFVEKSDFAKALAEARVKSSRSRKSSERVVLRTSSSNAPRKSLKKEEEAKVQNLVKATINPSRPPGFANFDDSEMRRIQVFERAAPSVVNVSTFTAHKDSVSTNIMEVPLGAGSGFLFDDVGHVVTNYHIVRNAKSLQVAMLTRVYSSAESSVPSKGQTPGMIDYIRRVYKAKVVGIDNDKDIAVLKIDAPMDDMHPIGLGSSNNLKVGQTALAIGNPFGLDHTLTVGVVSGTGREVKSPSGRPIANTIQTDAAINPGNSGGPLLDSSGKLIGMNTSIYSPSGGSAGIGFAIPVDTLKYVVDKLIRDGRIVRPGIGIAYLESKLAGSLGISKGVLVLDVPTSSPAFEAGLKGTRRTESGAIAIGDIIIRIENKKIDTEVDLFEALESFQPGDKVKITVIRVESPPTDTISPTTNEVTLTTTLVRATCSNIL